MQNGVEEKKSFQENIKEVFSNSTVSREFFSINRATIPKDMADAKRRVLSNLEKFKFHYLAMASMLLLVYVLYCPQLIILIAILATAAYIYRTRPTLFNVEIEPRSVCVAGGVGVFIFFIFFKSVITGLLAIIALCSIITLAHASLLEENLEDNEEEI